MGELGLRAIYPGPKPSAPGKDSKKYPHLLRDLEVTRPNQVWSTDITYIRMPGGFVYLTAVIDWYTRYILSWGLPSTLDSSFCIDALEEALGQEKPEIFTRIRAYSTRVIVSSQHWKLGRSESAWTGKAER